MNINFATQRPLPARGWRLLGLGVALCVSALWMHWHLAAAEAQLATNDVPAAPATASEPELSDTKRQRVNEALDHLGFDWPQALARLERAMTPGTSLLSADWRLPGRELKLQVEARGTAEMLGFIDALKRDPWLQGLKMVRQESTAGRVSFVLEGPVGERAP